MADANHLDSDPPENAMNLKCQSEKLISKASGNKLILLLNWRDMLLTRSNNKWCIFFATRRIRITGRREMRIRDKKRNERGQ